MTFILHKVEKSPLILASEIPDSLRLVIERIQGYSYGELYEEKDIQGISLEKSLITVFDAIEKEKNSLDISYCYFFMAIVMGIAVQPTIKNYLPRETITGNIFQYLFRDWIYSQHNYQPNFNVSFQDYQNYLGQYQALDEAVDVFENMLQVLKSVKTREAILNILDDCFQGYAIFPGSQGRRELFDWWLLDVVPSVFCGRLPKNIHTLKGIDKITKQITKIRNCIWKVVGNNQSQGNTDLEKQNLLLRFLAQ
ncbi:hypothetical protein MEO40_03990 [Dolichospermum sp. ST_sed1]|jgi:hypothetical protein|nr:hypothetical protein [Dolichospermum sp. ST_sed1]MDD1423667.1 hypothetical protein [Dolichospermum sp. ST_sed9]MDD1432663.1 hypothetical protein [Dolichospermum sp. ST_sed6]MDD1436278.1 hypothetical protein [Dolichospermum sp. ST_sed10]MDD1441220.1 hypothetical protein [Dolichospermum sp. ST_sed3]MDD1446996.1 hypothetical protein [Dolichospermum sp. ST_sed8]MDD1455996.1 hypothetical protein [Dolichospermum sp. ST_sed7]MDD1461781.1 hypothetical protein [Dolichospermum sp. ST_sed2]MDD14667